jgi:hypothetical protein
MVTMSILTLIGHIAGALGFVATLVAAVVVVRSSATKQTIVSQKELIDTLIAGKEEQKGQIADLHSKYNESTKAIAALQRQVDILKNIPLKEISGDLSAITKEMRGIANTQHQIVQILKNGGNAK